MQTSFTDTYQELDFFILRTPLLPLSTVSKLFDRPDTLFELLEDPLVREAIYIASPSLFAVYQRALDRITFDSDWKKAEISLFKYLLRMSFRCTPFGTMAGISLGHFGDVNQFVFTGRENDRKHCRLDMDVTGRILRELNRPSKEMLNLTFFANNTIYRIGQQYRYVEDTYVGGKRNHLLSSLDYSEEIELVFTSAKNGMAGTKLAGLLVQLGYSLEDSEQFIVQLIESRFIISEFSEQVTGMEFGRALADQLARYPQWLGISTTLSRVNAILQSEEFRGLGTPIASYQVAETLLKGNNIEFEPGHAFQIDLVKSMDKCVVSNSVVRDLRHALNFLVGISPAREHTNLLEFRRAFEERYEGKEVPLLEALDPEYGLGYPAGAPISKADAFVAALTVEQEATGRTLNKWNVSGWDRFMLEKYRDAISNGRTEIELTDSDPFIRYYMTSYREPVLYDLPPAFYSMFSLIKAADGFDILYILSSAPSSANLIARFCHADPALAAKVQDAMKRESQARPDAVIAEVVHLPESRIGNILARPGYHDYEIPIACASSKNQENTILLEDLLISIRSGKIVLRSRRLNKRIIPRQTTTHNFSYNSIHIYHFLCDLQIQEVPFSLNFNWGILSEFSYLPRVRYGRTILSRQSWAISEKHLQIDPKERKAAIQKIRDYVIAQRLPRFVILVEGDNELPLDLEAERSFHIVLEKLKKGLPIMIMENLFPLDGTRQDLGDFTNEIMIPFVTKDIINSPVSLQSDLVDRQIKRTFYPIEEQWIYLKLYCGETASDKLLTSVLFDLDRVINNEALVEKWFWIRYADPKHHLRLRYKAREGCAERLKRLISEMLMEVVESGLVYNITQDTYVRELERYGHSNIENSETLFWSHSCFVIKALRYLQENSLNQDLFRWMIVLRSVDDLLVSFEYSVEERVMFTDRMIAGYMQEFSFRKESFIAELSALYRANRPDLELILAREQNELVDGELQHLLSEKQGVEARTWSQVKKLMEMEKHTVSKFGLVSSYVHMLCNRLFFADQRFKELIVCDLLRQYYRSQIARTKVKKNIKADIPQ